MTEEKWMKVRNTNMASGELHKGEAVYAGDDKGIFRVPEAFGLWLCRTPGWSPARQSTVSAQTPETLPVVAPVKAPVPLPEPPKAEVKSPPPLPPKAPEPVAQEPEQPEEEAPAPEKPSVLWTKTQLLHYCSDHRISVDPRMSKTALLEAITG